VAPTDWSSDGRHILAWLFPWTGTAQDVGQLVTVDVETNEKRVLKSDVAGAGGGALAGAFFSPDARFVAFTTLGESEKMDIFLISRDGTRQTDLIRTPDEERLLGWLPDGSGILFHRLTRDSRALWKLPVQDGRPSGPPELVKDDVWQMRGIGFSDNAFFYGITVGNEGVHVASIDPETGRMLEGLTPVTEVSGTSSGPAWSPDGGRLAYIERDAGETRIKIRALTGEVLQEIPVTMDLRSGSRLAWVQDGILVDRAGADSQDLYLISLETGEASEIRETFGNTAVPIVSEDASKVYFHQRGEAIELDPRTGAEQPLGAFPSHKPTALPDWPSARVFESRISPDGRFVAYFVRSRNVPLVPFHELGSAVEIISRSSGELLATARLLSLQLPQRGVHKWSRDSRYLFFFGLEEGADSADRPHLMALSVEDGALRSFPSIYVNGWTKDLAVSSDGRHIAVTTDRSKAEVWRMTFNTGGR
jgi:Tol biopolymer transport system component